MLYCNLSNAVCKARICDASLQDICGTSIFSFHVHGLCVAVIYYCMNLVCCRQLSPTLCHSVPSLLQNVVEEAKKVNNLRLFAFAAKVRLDVFTKVKNAIHGRVAQLLKEKEDEIKHKDFLRGGAQFKSVARSRPHN